MSQALISRGTERTQRSAERTRHGAERPQITAMTCDIPVIDVRPAVAGRRVGGVDVCRPTGRAPRRMSDAAAPRRSNAPAAERRVERAAASVMIEQSQRRSAVISRSNTAAVIRRRRVVAAVLIGVALAGLVWMLAMVGESYQDAATPDVPSQTQVVYVRSGESLSDVAQRIAVDLPVAGVVEQLRDLNHLESAASRVGQPLVAPAY